MKLVLDSSAFARKYILEGGTERVYQFLQDASQLALCVLLVPEIVSGLNRRLREQVISPDDNPFDKKTANQCDTLLLQITPISRKIKLLENNATRAMDALHVACAMEWQAKLSADRRQVAAAKDAGLHTAFIGTVHS